jgi:predicted Zn-dependent protease
MPGHASSKGFGDDPMSVTSGTDRLLLAAQHSMSQSLSGCNAAQAASALCSMNNAQTFDLSLQARLLDSQKQALLGNRVLLLLAAQKLDAAGNTYEAVASRFPDYPRLKLLHAALLAQAGKVRVAEALIHLLICCLSCLWHAKAYCTAHEVEGLGEDPACSCNVCISLV